LKLRTRKVLNKLLFSQYPITIERLAKENEASIRTIRNDIKEINDFLNNNPFNIIETIRNEGVLLDVTENEIQKITNILEKEQTNIYFDKNIRQFNLILEISLGSNFFIYEKEKEFDISKSTLDSDMREIRERLESHNIELISYPKKGIKLVGSERAIRTMIFNQIFEKLGSMDVLDKTKHILPEFRVLFQFIPLKFVYKVSDFYTKFFSEVNDYIYKEQSIIFMGIWMQRNKGNNKLRSDSNKERRIDYEDNLKIFIEKVVSEFNIITNTKEMEYIYFMLNSLLNKTQTTPMDWVNAQVFTMKLINHVERKLYISFNKESDVLYERLLEHNLGLLSRMRNNMQIYNPLTENIRQNHQTIFKIVRDFSFSNSMISDYENSILDGEIAFLATHFMSAVSRKKQNEVSIYRAVVFCNYGLATGTLLAENLKQYFPIDIVAVLSTEEIYLLDKLDIDIVFSTSPMEIENIPYLVVDPIMNNKNMEVIQRFLDENSQYKHTLITNQDGSYNNTFTDIIELIKDEFGEVDSHFINSIMNVFNENDLNISAREIQPMIEDVLSDDGILLNVKVNDWEEAIREVSQPLLRKNIIEDRYVEAMINSVKEHGPYIVIGDHLALAHARPEDGVNELGLSVAILNPPINFGNEATDPVKIIFCLAAVDSYSHLNIMKSLVNLLNDNSKLSDFRNITSKEDFKNKLFKY